MLEYSVIGGDYTSVMHGIDSVKGAIDAHSQEAEAGGVAIEQSPRAKLRKKAAASQGAATREAENIV